MSSCTHEQVGHPSYVLLVLAVLVLVVLVPVVLVLVVLVLVVLALVVLVLVLLVLVVLVLVLLVLVALVPVPLGTSDAVFSKAYPLVNRQRTAAVGMLQGRKCNSLGP